MKSRYKLSPEALQDLREIWEFIAEDNIDAADSIQADLFAAFDGLVAMPHKGHQRHDLIDLAVLCWPVRSYLVICRPLGVRVVGENRAVAIC